METIAERLTKLKTHFKWTNSDMAREVGVSRQAIGKWFNQGAKPDIEKLYTLRKKRRVNEMWVLEGVGDMLIKPDDAFILALKELAPGIDGDGQEAILQIAKTLHSNNRKAQE